MEAKGNSVLPKAKHGKMTVHFGGPDVSMKPKEQLMKSNFVRTTKYTLISWAPLSLLFQFKRAANIYFLIISILTCMSFSPKSPYSMIGTFAVVLVFTMCKEAYEVFLFSDLYRIFNDTSQIAN